MSSDLLTRGRPKIMGILNLTPDSFSDGGLFLNVGAAVAHALTMVEDGADCIDVGGESTRPGSSPVSGGAQIQRVVAVIKRLRGELPDRITISIDTRRAEVAQAAIDAGASCINDVSAGHDDPRMFSVAARYAVPIILMHMQGSPETMQADPHYSDVVAEVKEFLLARVAAAKAAGISDDLLAIDPGIGFGKTRRHNLELLANLGQFVAAGFPVFLGTSRKRFMGSICAESRPQNLLAATCATTALGVAAGIHGFRVHDVKANRQAADVAWAIAHPE